MLRYIAKRLVMMIPILFGITIISFLVIHLAPGEPTDIAVDMNPNAAPEAKERLREIYGLNDPLHVQYFNWVKRIVVLDFGNSFAPDNRPVTEKIAETIPITIGGLGVREALYISILPYYAIPASAAVAFSAIADTTFTLAIGLVGAVVYITRKKPAQVSH